MTDPYILLMEECAEVTQAACKLKRFGSDAINPYTKKANIESFEEEVGDLLAIISFMVYNGTIDKDRLFEHSSNKIEKLKKWSDLFNEESSSDFNEWLRKNYVL